MKVLTAQEMRAIDQQAIAGGLSLAQMMKRAGRGVAEEIGRHLGEPKGRSILVLVGPGNNGGDGLVAAHHLHDSGAQISLYLWKRDTEGDENFELTQERDIPHARLGEDSDLQKLKGLLTDADIVVDALLGTGASLPLQGAITEILKALREERERRGPSLVAVDLPTGLEATTGEVDPFTVPADLTVTFAFPKRGHYLFPGAKCRGQLAIVDIGIPPSLAEAISVEVLTPDMVGKLLPPRPLDAHKGTFGKALVIAGSVNYTGAAYLASAAATRVGTGLVTLALAGSLHPILASNLTEVTFFLLPENLGAIAQGAAKLLADLTPEYAALLLGPGLGQDPATIEFVHNFLKVEEVEGRKPRIGFHTESSAAGLEEGGPKFPHLVIDADGLNALAKAPKWWKSLPKGNILTPHPGEMSRLAQISIEEVAADRIGLVRRLAKEWQQIVVLKGAHTFIANPEGRVTVNPFANPGLATAGTGDVLAGAIVGFLAQGLAPYDAALAGTFLHGLAGEMVAQELGDAGTVAGDLLPLLPKAIRALKSG